MSGSRVIPSVEDAAPVVKAVNSRAPAATSPAAADADPFAAAMQASGRETWLQYSARSNVLKQQLKELEAAAPSELLSPTDIPVPEPRSALELGGATSVLYYPAERSLLKIGGGVALFILALLMWAGAAALFFMDLVPLALALGPAVGFGIVLIIAGALLIALSKTRDHRVYWICNKGIAWQFGTQSDGCKWEAITDVTPRRLDGKPAYAITLNGKSTRFAQSGSAAEFAFGQYVASKAAHTLFVRILKRIIRGEAATIGTFELNRRGLIWQGAFTDWREVVSVSAEGDDVLIDLKAAEKSIAFSQSQVAHALVVLAVCRCIVQDKLFDPSQPPPSQGADSLPGLI